MGKKALLTCALMMALPCMAAKANPYSYNTGYQEPVSVNLGALEGLKGKSKKKKTATVQTEGAVNVPKNVQSYELKQQAQQPVHNDRVITSAMQPQAAPITPNQPPSVVQQYYGQQQMPAPVQQYARPEDYIAKTSVTVGGRAAAPAYQPPLPPTQTLPNQVTAGYQPVQMPSMQPAIPQPQALSPEFLYNPGALEPRQLSAKKPEAPKKPKKPVEIAKTAPEPSLIPTTPPAPLPVAPAPAKLPPLPKPTAALPPVPAKPAIVAAPKITPPAPMPMAAPIPPKPVATLPPLPAKPSASLPKLPPAPSAPSVSASAKLPPLPTPPKPMASASIAPIPAPPTPPAIVPPAHVPPAQAKAPVPLPVPAKLPPAPAAATNMPNLPTPPAPPGMSDEKIVGKPAKSAVAMAPSEINTAPISSTPSQSIIYSEAETELPLSDESKLQAVADKMAVDRGLTLNVLSYASGTADQAGQATRTSLARGLAVRRFLLDRNIERSRINVKPLGNKATSGVPDRVDLYLDRANNG